MLLKKLLAAGAVIALLAGCTPATTGGGPAPGQITDVIQKTHDAIVMACGWSEPLLNIARIFGSSSKLDTITEVRDAVCSAVVKPAARRGKVKAVVGGVVLQGGFVRR